MADLATLQTRLSEAEEALHKLATGNHRVEVSFGDRKVVYGATDTAQLRGYIGDLRQQIAAMSGSSQVFTITSRRGLQQ